MASALKHGVSRTANTSSRSEQARQKELQQIAIYKELVDRVNTRVAQRDYTTEVLALTTKLLNENPEYYTIWNHRRRILTALLETRVANQMTLESSTLDPTQSISGDLELTFALLRKFPKCYWIWNHRDWVLRKGETLMDLDEIQNLWSGELQLIGKMLQADSRNFHAWSYRRFIVAELKRLYSSQVGSSDQVLPEVWKLTESEFDYTTKMVKTNLSNFSAWHHRGQIIPQLLDQRGADSTARRKLFGDELGLICTAINTDPFDQSIWYYHQYLMSTLSPKCPPQGLILLDLNNNDRQEYYANEISYIRDILEDEADCKWIYESLLSLASSYLEVDSGTKLFTTLTMRDWLKQLQRLDPLRNGRWAELGRSLNICE